MFHSDSCRGNPAQDTRQCELTRCIAGVGSPLGCTLQGLVGFLKGSESATVDTKVNDVQGLTSSQHHKEDGKSS